MSQAVVKPKSMQRARTWSEVVEEGKGNCIFVSGCKAYLYYCTKLAYRFQLAGYRDEQEYLNFHKGKGVGS